MRSLTARLACLITAGALALTACGQREPIASVAPPAARAVGDIAGSTEVAPEVPGGAVVTFSVWARGALPARAFRLARSTDGVFAVGRVADSTVRARPHGGGTSRTITILAVEPHALSLTPSLSSVARALEQGDAALSAATSMRGLEPGDRVRLEGARSVDLRVGSMLQARTLFAREVVVPLDRGARLGIARPRAMIVTTSPQRYAAVAKRLVRAAGAGARIRPLQGADDESMVMSPEEVRRWFGHFGYVRGPGDSIIPDPRWVQWAITEYTMPVIGRVRCHRNIIPQLYHALHEIEQKGLGRLIESYDGCYVPRVQRLNDTVLSAHAYGIAIDFNAATNGQGNAAPAIDPRIVEIMERWGFAWGGRFRVPDGMHFEAARIVRPPR